MGEFDYIVKTLIEKERQTMANGRNLDRPVYPIYHDECFFDPEEEAEWQWLMGYAQSTLLDFKERPARACSSRELSEDDLPW